MHAESQKGVDVLVYILLSKKKYIYIHILENIISCINI